MHREDINGMPSIDIFKKLLLISTKYSMPSGRNLYGKSEVSLHGKGHFVSLNNIG